MVQIHVGPRDNTKRFSKMRRFCFFTTYNETRNSDSHQISDNWKKIGAQPI